MIMLEAHIIASRLATKQNIVKVIDLVSADKLHPIVTNSYPISDFQSGFKALEQGEILGRGVFTL